MPTKKKKDTPTSVAQAAGCSRQLADRLLRRGMTRAAIIERCARRREAEGGRGKKKTLDQNSDPGFSEAAAGKVASITDVPPFAESQRLKEHHLATLRGLEVRRRKGELLPVEPWRSVVGGAMDILRVRFQALPDELINQIGRENTEMLHRRIRHIFDEARRHMAATYARYGVTLPPKSPKKPPELLADYQQYTADGDVVNVPRSAQVNSYEWGQLHPSRKDWFKLMAKKRQWDTEMAALIVRRSEWDLPPEVPAPPEPEVA
jgi:hypothetical protein